MTDQEPTVLSLFGEAGKKYVRMRAQYVWWMRLNWWDPRRLFVRPDVEAIRLATSAMVIVRHSNRTRQSAERLEALVKTLMVANGWEDKS